MSLLEESPAPAVEVPAAEPLVTPRFAMTFPEGGEGYITAHNDAAGTVVEVPDSPPAETPEKPAEEPVPESPAPEPGTEETPSPAKDWAAILADLTPEETKELVKSNPLLKRYLDGELGTRLQQKLAAEEARLREKLAAEIHEDETNFNKAWSEYEEIESWRDPNSDNYDPERYENEVRWTTDPETGQRKLNTAYANWVRDLFGWRETREAAKQPKQQQALDINTAWKTWNDTAIPEVKEILSTSVPWWKDMPVESRRAIEAVAFNPEGNWMREALTQFVTGTKTYVDKAIREGVETARAAGRTEALAEREADAPVMVNGKTGTARTDDQILIEYMNNGFSGGLTREELDGAYQRKGMNL